MSMLSALNKYSILYVEDEQQIQSSVAEYLSNYFVTIYLASTGQDALDLYHQHKPDVLLLDINLPDIDGLTIARRVRDSDSATKIIMLTAYDEKDQLLKATELKLTKYLVKPVAPKAFKEMLTLLARELIDSDPQYFRLGAGYFWSINKAELYDENGVVTLSEKEHRLLKLFIRFRGETITYEKISYTVWECSHERGISQDSIKSQVSQLRKHLPTNSIVSVYGEGYMLK